MIDIDVIDGAEERVMRLTGVDLNLLVAFDALMSERSVSRAADRLSIGQPAMSATLGRLRRVFDDPLLVRQGRGLVPTPLAESLAEPIHEILSRIDETLSTARSGFDPTTDRRSFSVMTSDYVTLVFLRHLLTQLDEEAPHIRVRVRPVTADFREQLRRNLTDLIIVPDDVLGDGHEFPTRPLFSDRFLCAVHRDNPDIGGTITVEQFSEQPYLAYNVGPLPSLIEQQLDAAGITRNLEISTEAFVLAPHILRGTRLLTVLHRRLAEAMPEDLGVRLLEPPMPLKGVTEVMAWAPRHEHDPAHAWFREQLLRLAGRL
ncbi:LysR substrate-binding domain-containing protein [Actinomycetospora endophytica]|uniref:LysR substrate-binding domain-containing protein n=1 Tax=Actinomycetospora endophytica TaxID=2291215 RepID=A0ABS8P1J2_9PSEU|nr:LysR family transcriptional regulator [Actinomycetospora endophytica]MCD2191959.1 LysR substrate-binding domain-containing protein [Actinomycetospora endophytica]